MPRQLDSPPVRIEVTAEPLEAVDADLHVTGCSRATSWTTRTASCRARATSRGGFRKHDAAAPRRRPTAPGGRPRQARGARPRAPAGLRRRSRSRRPAATRPRRSPGRCRESGGAGVTPATLAAGLVEGTILASFRFDRFKSRDPDDPAAPRARAPGDLGAGLRRRPRRRGRPARAWRPRRPTAPASSRPCPRTSSPRRTWPTAPARSPAPTTSVERRGAGPRPRSTERGMGGLAPSPRAAREEPQLIVLRYCRRRRGRRDARPRRQGRHLRHRRDLDQARGEDGGDEDGHVGRRRRARGDRRDRRARAARSTSSPASRRPRTCRAGRRPSPATSSPSSTARPSR